MTEELGRFHRVPSENPTLVRYRSFKSVCEWDSQIIILTAGLQSLCKLYYVEDLSM